MLSDDAALELLDELHEEMHLLVATIGSVEFLYPGCFVEGDWIPNFFFCFMWNDTDRIEHEVKRGKKEKIKQKEERLAPGTFGKKLFEKVLTREKTVLFDFDVDDEFQKPLIRVATRLFRYQLVLSVCVELIREVCGLSGPDPNARAELMEEWKKRGLYIERAQYNYKPPPKQMR